MERGKSWGWLSSPPTPAPSPFLPFGEDPPGCAHGPRHSVSPLRWSDSRLKTGGGPFGLYDAAPQPCKAAAHASALPWNPVLEGDGAHKWPGQSGSSKGAGLLCWGNGDCLFTSRDFSWLTKPGLDPVGERKCTAVLRRTRGPIVLASRWASISQAMEPTYALLRAPHLRLWPYCLLRTPPPYPPEPPATLTGCPKNGQPYLHEMEGQRAL